MRIPQPWQRTSTGTWHVVIDGKQKYLGKTENEARGNYERLMDRGVWANSTVREIVQAYWAATPMLATPSWSSPAPRPTLQPSFNNFEKSCRASRRWAIEVVQPQGADDVGVNSVGWSWWNSTFRNAKVCRPANRSP